MPFSGMLRIVCSPDLSAFTTSSSDADGALEENSTNTILPVRPSGTTPAEAGSEDAAGASPMATARAAASDFKLMSRKRSPKSARFGKPEAIDASDG